ncbi:MAG: ATP-binding protein [Haliscomenobacter sp.]|nr:ATP-binding protein [Haliscomenobacter sp.]
MDFSANRQGLNKANILQLASCNFIQRGEHILITGPTGVGKSFLATALGNTACIKGLKSSSLLPPNSSPNCSMTRLTEPI